MCEHKIFTFMPILISDAHVSDRGACLIQETWGVTKSKLLVKICSQSNPGLKNVMIIINSNIFINLKNFYLSFLGSFLYSWFVFRLAITSISSMGCSGSSVSLCCPVPWKLYLCSEKNHIKIYYIIYQVFFMNKTHCVLGKWWTFWGSFLGQFIPLSKIFSGEHVNIFYGLLYLLGGSFCLTYFFFWKNGIEINYIINQLLAFIIYKTH